MASKPNAEPAEAYRNSETWSVFSTCQAHEWPIDDFNALTCIRCFGYLLLFLMHQILIPNIDNCLHTFRTFFLMFVYSAVRSRNTSPNVFCCIGWNHRIRNERIRNIVFGDDKFSSLEQQIKIHRIRWLGHVLRMPGNRLPHKALYAIPKPEWRRTRGG